MLITDHHLPGDQLPDADALVIRACARTASRRAIWQVSASPSIYCWRCSAAWASKARCSTKGTLATHGNLNNDIGVPLTLLRLNAEHRQAVIELGANAPAK